MNVTKILLLLSLMLYSCSPKNGEMNAHESITTPEFTDAIAESEAKEDSSNETPKYPNTTEGLFSAIFYSNKAEVERLIAQEGVNVNAQIGHNGTALHWAVKELQASKFSPYHGDPEKNLEIVRLLLEAGAVPNAKMADGYLFDWGQVWSIKGQLTPLMISIGYIPELLIAYGADVNAQNEYGLTALMINSYFGWTEAMQTLIKHGATIDAQDNNGQTALFYSIRSYGYSDKTDATKLLLDNGASVTIKNNWGLTALAWAHVYFERFEEEKATISAILESFGASLDSSDESKIAEMQEIPDGYMFIPEVADR
jgi:ankyrin repeat protein